MKTSEDCLRETGLRWDEFKRDFPQSSSKTLWAMELYVNEHINELNNRIFNEKKEKYEAAKNS